MADRRMESVAMEWVVTVIGRGVINSALGPVGKALKEAGLGIDGIEALSGASGAETAYACAAIRAHGALTNLGATRSGLLRLADELSVDIALQHGADYGRERRLFCFDMDSTLIQGEVIDELAKMAGVADRVVAITAEAMRGEIEFQESFRRRVGLLAGLPGDRLAELLEQIPLMEGAERLFRTLKARGGKSAILSGGFTFFGAHLEERLGVDHVFANELEMDAAGFVAGTVRGRIVDGARKAELLREIADSEGIGLEKVVAVGDGANDLPMLALAGMGVAFHAKPVVRAAAEFAMSRVGLDGLLYLLGVPDWEWAQ